MHIENEKITWEMLKLWQMHIGRQFVWEMKHTTSMLGVQQLVSPWGLQSQDCPW